MEEGTSTSLEAGNYEIPELKRWTKDLNMSSWFSEAQEIRLINSKDKYIGKVEDKANVVKGKKSCFLVKGCVNAAIKSKVKPPCICSFKPSKQGSCLQQLYLCGWQRKML